MNSNLIDKMKVNLDTNLINKKNKINKDHLFKKLLHKNLSHCYVFRCLKSARKAKLADVYFNNKGTETYQGLLDQEYSKKLIWSTKLWNC